VHRDYVRRFLSLESVLDLSELRKFVNDLSEVFISSGSLSHWRNSIEYALRSGGYVPWGTRAGGPLLGFFKGLFAKCALRLGERSEEVSNLSVGRGSGMYNAVVNTAVFIDRYLRSEKPILLLFYSSNVKFIGAGLATTVVIDKEGLFWDEEFKVGRPVFPLRWFAKVILLHSSIRASPLNIEDWVGWECREVLGKDITPRISIQRFTDVNVVEAVKRFLLRDDVWREIQETLNWSKSLGTLGGEALSTVPPLTVDADSIIKEVRSKLAINQDVIQLLIASLLVGRNVILIGKPGTGKTALARMVAELLGYKPLVATANAHWSRLDVIGGMVLKGSKPAWRSGYLVKALVEHIRCRRQECGSRWRGAYLIIDEVNRADVDKAFGEFFTIFAGVNPSEWVVPSELVEEIKAFDERDEYGEEFLRFVNEGLLEPINGTGYRVPKDFRVICTMNYVDARNLFVVGEAFTRRFARILVPYPSDLDHELRVISTRISRELGDENVVRIVEKVKPLIECVVESLRRIEGISFGPAHLYSALSVALTLVSKAKLSVVEAFRRGVETTLSLAPFWDEEIYSEVGEAFGRCFDTEGR